MSKQIAELEDLDSALAACARGNGQVVLVEGPIGCGKSELLATFAERASSSGAVVVSTAGEEYDRDNPFNTLRRLSSAAVPIEVPAIDEGGARAELIRRICKDLLDGRGDAPLVCLVDDLHYVDAASLEGLLYLIRLTRTAPVLVVLSQTAHFALLDSGFSTELLRMRNVRPIVLSRLGHREVAEIVSGYPELAARAADHATEFGRVSGGNPLLLRALIAERRNSVGEVPAAGGPFAQAVVTCARRSNWDGLRLAAAVAVLGERACPERLAELIGSTRSAVAQALAALNASGILDGTVFRHPVGRTAVVDNLPRSELSALHRRAAGLLHQTGALPQLVAQHLVASVANEAEPSWVVDVLRSGAEQALADDNPRYAARLLERAHAASPDLLLRGQIKTRLAAITWRLDPALSERHINDAFDTLKAADATEQSVWPLAQLLVAHGRIANAIEIRNRALSATEGASPADDIVGSFAGADVPHLATIAEPHQFALLDANVADVERFLESTSLAGPTLPGIVQAVAALARSHDPQRAVRWSHTLLEESALRNARGWRFVFTSMLAFALLRLGDLRGAEHYSLQALDLVPGGRNCVFTYSAVATLIRARTEMRDFAAAAVEVYQPMPAQLFRSIHGLNYLRARGRYLAATNQLHAALGDFLQAGSMMKQWNLDRPVICPWRTEAAEVLRRMGETDAVEQLVLQQLSTPDARHPWIRGISLRTRAAISHPRKRALLLQQAVSELRRSGDRVELARTLADLGVALQEVEDPVAVVMSQQAVGIATECGANSLLEDIRHRSPALRRVEPNLAPSLDTVDAANARLSESERRVAALAALKYTNREISRLLHVTVSTVEQHLTNVYRKLHIEGRRSLPANLELYTVDFA
ncbi:AAA family ATPase [Micromonospora sp. NPDC049275]|uniref:AAA family ATPase n=1 Tax=Micromonospora sp. NPDC049275 TaxID=3364268 RepID=UPI0037123838